MVEPFIVSSEFVTKLILPFLLVFTLIFAILDKIKIFGEGKRQINAIIAFVIGLLLIAFPFARDIIVYLMPVLAVIAVIFLVFIMLYSFASGGDKVEIPKGLKIAFGIIIGVALIITLLVLTGAWNFIVEEVNTGSNLIMNIIFVAIIIAAILVVALGGKSP